MGKGARRGAVKPYGAASSSHQCGVRDSDASGDEERWRAREPGDGAGDDGGRL